MTDQQRAAHIAQSLRELDRLAYWLETKAAHLHELGGRGEWPYDLQTAARRVSSTRDYLRDYLRELEP